MHYEGLNIAVFDADYGCMMDWVSLFVVDGQIYFKTTPQYVN